MAVSAVIDGGAAGAVATIASVACAGVGTRASVATGSVSRAVVTCAAIVDGWKQRSSGYLNKMNNENSIVITHQCR